MLDRTSVLEAEMVIFAFVGLGGGLRVLGEGVVLAHVNGLGGLSTVLNLVRISG